MDATAKQLLTDDGTKITYTVNAGDGPPVVLLHGLAGSSRELVPTALALADRRVVLVDQRGHGLSSTYPRDTSREAFVSDVVRVITAETSEPVTLVGHSMGAHTAMLVAAARPDLVRQLVMLEGNQGGGSAEDHAALGDFFRSWDAPFPSRREPPLRWATGRSHAPGQKTCISAATASTLGSTPTSCSPRSRLSAGHGGRSGRASTSRCSWCSPTVGCSRRTRSPSSSAEAAASSASTCTTPPTTPISTPSTSGSPRSALSSSPSPSPSRMDGQPAGPSGACTMLHGAEVRRVSRGRVATRTG